ncbi:hypothetical protein FRB96_000520 [Tulasnella sp. 330]|nr:hypothetical protein FRB96_000520 [Tulasnella sp. 330]KAG8880659.1 hypothetical protein FRB97_000613 [Tulasnella sp. 331]KAG8888190.1 hypothetical protein FRB98_008208 [Tulasnella sp. 332]
MRFILLATLASILLLFNGVTAVPIQQTLLRQPDLATGVVAAGGLSKRSGKPPTDLWALARQAVKKVKPNAPEHSTPEYSEPKWVKKMGKGKEGEYDGERGHMVINRREQDGNVDIQHLYDYDVSEEGEPNHLVSYYVTKHNEKTGDGWVEAAYFDRKTNFQTAKVTRFQANRASDPKTTIMKTFDRDADGNDTREQTIHHPRTLVDAFHNVIFRADEYEEDGVAKEPLSPGGMALRREPATSFHPTADPPSKASQNSLHSA